MPIKPIRAMGFSPCAMPVRPLSPHGDLFPQPVQPCGKGNFAVGLVRCSLDNKASTYLLRRPVLKLLHIQSAEKSEAAAESQEAVFPRVREALALPALSLRRTGFEARQPQGNLSWSPNSLLQPVRPPARPEVWLVSSWPVYDGAQVRCNRQMRSE